MLLVRPQFWPMNVGYVVTWACWYSLTDRVAVIWKLCSFWQDATPAYNNIYVVLYPSYLGLHPNWSIPKNSHLNWIPVFQVAHIRIGSLTTRQPIRTFRNQFEYTVTYDTPNFRLYVSILHVTLVLIPIPY